MEESQPLTTIITRAECSCCFEKINPADQFCQKCGFPLKGSDEEQKRFFQNRNYQHLEMDTLKKKISSAAISLYVLGVIFLAYALIFFFIHRSEESSSIVLITYAIVGVIFLLLGAWAATKPVASIISGITLYALLLLLDLIANPASIFSGIIFKIIIISYLIKGLLSALEAEKIKKQYNI